MNIELKNIKFSEAMSEETNCFTADLFVDGKKVAYVKNNGCGGSTDYVHYNHLNREIVKNTEAYCQSLPDINYGNFSVKNNLENQIDILFEKWLDAKFDSKVKAKVAKDCKKGLCYGTPTKYQMFFWKNFDIETMLKSEKGREILKKTVDELKAKGETILNTNLIF